MPRHKVVYLARQDGYDRRWDFVDQQSQAEEMVMRPSLSQCASKRQLEKRHLATYILGRRRANESLLIRKKRLNDAWRGIIVWEHDSFSF